MGRRAAASIAVPTSAPTAGAATPCGTLDDKTVTLESVGTATYQLQISLDTTNPPAAASWQNEGAAFTNAGGTLQVTKPCEWMRFNCTAYTNGTPIGRLLGRF
jgi:hypothetical protein